MGGFSKPIGRAGAKFRMVMRRDKHYHRPKTPWLNPFKSVPLLKSPWQAHRCATAAASVGGATSGAAGRKEPCSKKTTKLLDCSNLVLRPSPQRRMPIPQPPQPRLQPWPLPKAQIATLTIAAHPGTHTSTPILAGALSAQACSAEASTPPVQKKRQNARHGVAQAGVQFGRPCCCNRALNSNKYLIHMLY